MPLRTKQKGLENADGNDVTFCLSERSGEVDWNTLGNILTAHILGEVRVFSWVKIQWATTNTIPSPK